MGNDHISTGPVKATTELLAHLREEIESLPEGWVSVPRSLGRAEQEIRAWLNNDPPVSMDDLNRVAAAVFWLLFPEVVFMRIHNPDTAYRAIWFGELRYKLTRPVPGSAQTDGGLSSEHIDAITSLKEFKEWLAGLLVR